MLSIFSNVRELKLKTFSSSCFDLYFLFAGEKVFEVNLTDSSVVCLAGESKGLLVVFNTNNATLTDLTEGKTISTIEGDDRFVFGFPGIACGMFLFCLC